MASRTTPLPGAGTKRMPAAPLRALSLPHFPHVSPSATAIAAIVLVTLLATIFIYTSVANGFTSYNAAVATIRAQREVLNDLLNEDTAANGYFNTQQRLFIAEYMKIAARTPRDLRRLQAEADASGIPVAPLIVDALRESYFQYTVDLKHLFTIARVSDVDQEIPRKLQVAMRSDLLDFQRYSKTTQDATIASVGHTVLGGSIGLFLAAVALGLLGIMGDNARRHEQRTLAHELDARNRELERSNAALQDFAYIASHDLQEPLRTVSSYTQLLQKRFGNRLGAEGAEFIAFATDAASRMEQLIDALLEYSRVTVRRVNTARASIARMSSILRMRNILTRISGKRREDRSGRDARRPGQSGATCARLSEFGRQRAQVPFRASAAHTDQRRAAVRTMSGSSTSITRQRDRHRTRAPRADLQDVSAPARPRTEYDGTGDWAGTRETHC